MKRVAPLLLALALVWAFVTTWLSADSFAIAAGSDSGVRIYTPSLWLKGATLVAIGGAWSIPVLMRDMRLWQRLALSIAGLAALCL